MIAKIAVSAATFAIDKPYSYAVPMGMELQPGMRVMVPFGRSNRRTEGVILRLEEGSEEKLKAVDRSLDEEAVLSPLMLQLAVFMRERYFCTLYDAVRTMLPAGLWFQSKESYALTEDRTWQEKTPRQPDAVKLLQLLEELGGSADGACLRESVPDEEAFSKAVAYLLRKNGSLPGRICPVVWGTRPSGSQPWQPLPRKPWLTQPADQNPRRCSAVFWN